MVNNLGFTPTDTYITLTANGQLEEVESFDWPLVKGFVAKVDHFMGVLDGAAYFQRIIALILVLSYKSGLYLQVVRLAVHSRGLTARSGLHALVSEPSTHS